LFCSRFDAGFYAGVRNYGALTRPGPEPVDAKAKGKRQKAKGKRQKAKGKRQKAKGKRQKAKGKCEFGGYSAGAGWDSLYGGEVRERVSPHAPNTEVLDRQQANWVYVRGLSQRSFAVPAGRTLTCGAGDSLFAIHFDRLPGRRA
jgi:hypothetical protein